MNIHILRHRAFEHFHQLRRRASLLRWWRWLRRQPQTLLPLAPIRAKLPNTQTLLPERQMVPVRQIVGSLQRAHDYDRQLRPLNDSLQNRWVNINIQQEVTGWTPVELIQVGNLYFIVDGHHRCSVARHEGVPFIEAIVTVYPLSVQFDSDDSLDEIFLKLQAPKQHTGEYRQKAGANCSPAVCFSS